MQRPGLGTRPSLRISEGGKRGDRYRAEEAQDRDLLHCRAFGRRVHAIAQSTPTAICYRSTVGGSNRVYFEDFRGLTRSRVRDAPGF